MIFLIVEDDDNKGEQLQRFLSDTYPDVHLDFARSLRSAVKYVKSSWPQLIVLDMTLPNYDASPDEPGGGSVHSFG
ncbi:response regulator, partial [Klebsiella pneumoniae]|uniref:response regulator n=1 Tax=Klebsiella pneumoniae TaxID=573 RepID=UPI0013D1CB10